MRMRRHHQQDEDTGIDLTPMLDVVFIMLIFLIAITADGQVWMDKKVVDVRSVRAHVERMRVDQPDGAVVVQADQDARTGLVVQVMDQARLAGVHDVALAATAGAL
jgi:biopolymer transport protein ExbD